MRYHDAASDLTSRLLAFCELDASGRSALRSRVEAHSHAFDWARLASAYHDVHDRVLAASEAPAPSAAGAQRR